MPRAAAPGVIPAPGTVSPGVPVVPQVPYTPLDTEIAYPGNRFPAGAVWLIVLGLLFLVGNSGIFG